MAATAPSFVRIARAYRLSRQAVFNLRRRHGLTPADLADPDGIFELLLDHDRKGKLRELLVDPVERQRIRAALQ